MTIGVKLDIGFSENKTYRQLFGVDDPFQLLWDLGIRAVEAAVDPKTDLAVLTTYTRKCSDAGFRVSLHPYSELTPFNPANFNEDGLCRRFHSRVFVAAQGAAQKRGEVATVNIHGAAAPREQNRRSLLDRTIRFFAWARQWCIENTPGVKPVVELQFRPHPDETIQRIGDGYEELGEIARRAEVDTCWDFGHAYMNASRFGVPLDPPEELLDRVVHIHCHDVKDSDHYPLVFDRVPWERMLTAALERAFDGAVILEVPPENFLSAGGLPALVRSVEKLKAVSAARFGA